MQQEKEPREVRGDAASSSCQCTWQQPRASKASESRVHSVMKRPYIGVHLILHGVGASSLHPLSPLSFLHCFRCFFPSVHSRIISACVLFSFPFRRLLSTYRLVLLPSFDSSPRLREITRVLDLPSGENSSDQNFHGALVAFQGAGCRIWWKVDTL